MHISHHGIDIGLSQELSALLVLGDDQQQIHRDVDHLVVLLPLLHRRIDGWIDRLVLDAMVSVEIGAHSVDDVLQIAVGGPVVDQHVPVVLVEHDVANHVDDALPADGIPSVDVRNQLRDQLPIRVHYQISSLVELVITPPHRLLE